MRFEALGLHSLRLLTAPTRKPAWSEESNGAGEKKYEGISASGFKLELKLFYNFFIVYCRCIYFILLQQVMEQEYIVA